MNSNNETHDYLHYTDDSDIKKLIRSEKVLFSDKIIKINKYSMSQERNILVTDIAVYNFKKKDLKRRFEIKTLKGITVSKITDEFVIHGNDIEYDYNYISPKKKIIIQKIAESFRLLKNNEIPFCEIDAKSLKPYVTLKDEKKKDLNFSRMPLSFLSNVREYYDNFSSSKVSRNGTIFSGKKNIPEVKLQDFKPIKVLGRGSFGKVTLVEFTKTGELFAMKSLKKDVLLDQDQIENTLLERKILSELDHPFLVNLVFCFQTEDRVYFVLPFVVGGELFQHLKKFRVFDEEK